MAAFQPRILSARLVSSRRRGCPFGIVSSQTISPAVPVSSFTSPASSAIAVSVPVPMLSGSAPE